MNFQGAKGNINYDLFASKSSRADEIFFKQRRDIATSWRHCGKCEVCRSFFIINR